MQADSVTSPFPDPPFGLDMSFSNPPHATNPAFSNMDLSFDQTLGLDLAPGYDYTYPSFNVDMNLGLDLVGGQAVRRKKKMAWLEVERLIDGEWRDLRCTREKLTRDRAHQPQHLPGTGAWIQEKGC
jgi:hypothetical protein